MAMSYLKFDGDKVLDARTGGKVPRSLALDAAVLFHARIKLTDHLCLGAHAAFAAGNVRLAFIEHLLGSIEAARHALKAIDLFLEDLPALKPPFRPLIFVFKGPRTLAQQEGHEMAWNTLHAMNVTDRAKYECVSTVSEDPESPDFAFSWRGHSWFVNAGFLGSPRMGRDFEMPTWIINLQENFDLLREMRRFDSIKKANARRDIEYQGNTNPTLKDKGKGDQWSQVTSVEGQRPPTICPFHHQH